MFFFKYAVTSPHDFSFETETRVKQRGGIIGPSRQTNVMREVSPLQGTSYTTDQKFRITY